jgi:TP901 family phage tail tape measure protein
MKAIAVRPLALDMDDLGTKTAMAAQKAQIFNQVLKQGSTNLLNFGKNTQWAGRQLMVGFTIPLGIFGAAAAKEFMKLEEQSIRFKRVYGETFTPPEEADKMLDQLKELGNEYTKYGVAIEKTLGIAADAAAMGKQGAELLAQVKNASDLAVLGGVDQEQALETTISLTNAFGVAADDLAGKINFLNAVENQTVTSIEDLTEAIPKAGPVVQQLGGDVEDLAFFLTAMKEGGINASEGANALKSGLASMINPSGQAVDMLSELGINLKGIVESNAGDVKGTVVQFAQALDTLDPLNRARAIEQLFGKFQFARISTLFENVVAEGSQANRVLKLTQASTEELAVLSERELKRVEDSPMFKFQKAVEQFQASLAPVGEAFLKAVTPIVQFGTDILSKFNELGDGAKQFWTIVVTAVAAVGPVLLMTFGLIANGVANIIKLFSIMRSGFIGLAGGSSTLGEQTQYMTNEQLEAAAVASSLNQVHSNLIQTFTSERSAVQQLTAAYRNAAIAIQGVQRPMMPGAPMPGPAPKKYADGTFMVPGPKGAGDVVPAMLTPGEAVIPADRAEQYRGLIQGIIAGKIPGFFDGTAGVALGLSPEDANWLAGVIPTSMSDKQQNQVASWAAKYMLRARSKEDPKIAEGIKALFEERITAGDTSIAAIKRGAQSSQENIDRLAAVSPKTRPLSQQEHRLHAEEGKKESPAEFMGREFESDDVKLRRTKRLAELAQIAGMDDTSGINFDTKSAFLRMGNAQLNLDQAGGGADINAFQQDFASRSGVAAYGGKAGTIKAGGGSESDQDLISAFDEFDQTVVGVFEEKKAAGVKFIADNSDQIKQLAKKRAATENRPVADIEKEYETLDNIYGEAQQRLATNNPNNKALSVIDKAKSKALEVRINASQENQRKLLENLPEDLRPEAAEILDANFRGGRTGNTVQVRGQMDPKAEAEATGKAAGEAYNAGVESASGPENDPFNVNRDKANRGSPHKQAGIDGADDAKAYNDAVNANMEKQKQATQKKNEAFKKQEEANTRVAQQEAEKRRKWAEEDAALGINSGAPAPVKPTPKKPTTLVTGEVAMDNVQAAQNSALLASGRLSGSGSRAADAVVGKLSGGLEWLRGKSPKLAGVIDKRLSELDRSLDLSGQYAEEARQIEERANAAKEKLVQAYEAEAARLKSQGIEGDPVIDPSNILDENELAAIGASGGATERERRRQQQVENRRGRQRVAGSVAMGASMAVGMGSMMGGPIGEFSQKIAPVVMGFSLLGPLIAGLPGPLAIALAAIAALGTAVFLTVDAMNKARDSALKLAEVTGAGTKAMEKFAEFAGTVTASQELKERRQNNMEAFGVQTGKDSFGANYMQSEQGKVLLDTVKKEIESNKGNIQELQNNIINQMSTAVATGALNPEQARSIVAQLGEEMGDVNFSIRVNSELIDLLGPNGENILTDPLGVRLKIMDQSQRDLKTTLAGITGENLAGIQGQAAGGVTAGIGGGIAGGIAGGVAGGVAGAGLTALGFAAAGSAAGPVGAVAGAIAGAAYGAVQIADSFAKLESSAAAFTGSGLIALQQQQEMLDSLQLQYEQRIQIAQAAGDTAEADRLSQEYIEGRSAIIAKGAEARATLVDAFTNADFATKGAMGRSLDTAIEQQYADNPLMQGIAVEARNQVVAGTADTAAGNELEYSLKLALADTNVDPQQILNLMNTFKEGQGVIEGYINVQNNLGSADGNRSLQLMNMFVDKDGNPVTEHQASFMANLEVMDQAQATKYLDMMQEVSKVEGIKELDYVMEFYLENPEEGYKVLDQINKVKEAAGEGPITLTMIQELIGGQVADIVAQNQAYFDSLDKNQQVVYTQTLLTIYETRGTPEYKGQLQNWLTETGQSGKWKKDGKLSDTERKLMDEFDAAQAYKATEATPKTQKSEVEVQDTAPSGGGGGGRQGSVLDDLLQKLRRIQIATIGLTEGWKGARLALDNLFPGGGSNSPFEGIEQQMRRLGAKEDLITMIAGMDPEEFQKRKNELFTFDGAGNIVGFRNSLLSIGAAMRSIAFGDFQNQQQKNIGVIKDQNIAIQKLVRLGYSMADAYKMVENAAFASAVAQESNTEIIRKSAAEYSEATKQAKLFAAAQAAATANASVADKSAVTSWLQQNSRGLSNEVIQEMLRSQEFATLMMSPTLTQEQKDALNKWIYNVENAANLEIEADLVPGNRDGRIKRFEDGFSKAMDKFSVMEKEIELRFKVQKDPFIQTAEAASQMIEDIQNRTGGLDDLQADLERISYKEEDINKRYDERLDALNEIKRINDRISAQQKGQLSVADALSQGDIAAAARAAQEARAQAAEQALNTEQQLLEKAKEAEIEALTAQTGMTREQIETRIRDLKQQILHIEETMLEPAQYALTLLERQEKAQKESLTVLGRTRAEWESIKNRIDLARVNSKQYEDAIKLALKVVDDIVEAWKEIEKPKRTEHTIVTYHQNVYDGAPSGTPSGDGSPGTGPGTGPAGSQQAATDASAAAQARQAQQAKKTVQQRFSEAMAARLPAPARDAVEQAKILYDNAIKQVPTGQWVRVPGGGLKQTYKAAQPPVVIDSRYNNLISKLKSVGFNKGGLVSGYGSGDTIRAMLTPGEFVMTKPAVDAYGANMMKDINNGTFQSGSVYNYSISLNVKSESDADQIANVVMTKIKGIEDKRIRGNRF